MARDAVTKQARDHDGLVVTMATVSAGNVSNGFKTPWTPTAEIWVTNSDTNARTVSIKSPSGLSDGRTISDVACTVPASSTVPVVLGPYDASYKQADGYLYFDFDAATGAKVAVVD
jgi:hypothetical protein